MKKKHLIVLNRITGSIPKHLLDALIYKEPATPTIKKVFRKALKDEDIRPELKEQIKALVDLKIFDEKIEVVDRDVEKEIEAYLDAEIKKAIKKGELPPMTKARAIHKKLKQYYARKSRATQKS